MLGVLALHCIGLKMMFWSAREVFARNFSGEDLPGFTRLVLGLNQFTIFVPLPWFVFCIIQGFRSGLTAGG